MNTPTIQISQQSFVAYYSLDTDEESAKYELEKQIREVNKYLEGKPWKIEGYYTEEVFSNTLQKVPTLLYAIDKCRHLSAKLIITKIHPQIYQDYFSTLEESGIDFVILSHPYRYRFGEE